MKVEPSTYQFDWRKMFSPEVIDNIVKEEMKEIVTHFYGDVRVQEAAAEMYKFYANEEDEKI